MGTLVVCHPQFHDHVARVLAALVGAPSGDAHNLEEIEIKIPGEEIG